MVKSLEFSEADGFNIESIYRGLTRISTFEIVHLIRKKLASFKQVKKHI